MDAVFSQRMDKLNLHGAPGLFAIEVLKLDPDGVLTSRLDSSGPPKERLDPSRLPMKDLEQLGCSTPASMVTMDVRAAAISRRHVFSSSAGPISIRGTEYTRSPDHVLVTEQTRSREHTRSSENMRRSELIRGSAEHMRSSEYMSSAEQLRSIEIGRRVDYLQRPEGHFARQKVSFSVFSSVGALFKSKTHCVENFKRHTALQMRASENPIQMSGFYLCIPRNETEQPPCFKT